jgi:sec-independent protein translocase protein TatA
MGLDNPIHIAFLLILLLLVFGAKRLPEMGRSLGDGMRGFKDAIGGESTHAPTAAATAAPTYAATVTPTAVIAPAPATSATATAQPTLVAEQQDTAETIAA